MYTSTLAIIPLSLSHRANTATPYRILIELQGLGPVLDPVPVTAAALATRLSVHRNTVTAALAWLVANGYLEQHKHLLIGATVHRRAYSVNLKVH